MSVLIGADPEFFFQNKRGVTVPAEKLLPWKDEPMPVLKNSGYSCYLGKPKAALHADGIQGEITAEPNTCRAYFLDKIWYALKKAHELAEEKGYHITTTPVVTTPLKTVLERASEKGREFGCDPDRVAWLDGEERQFSPEPWHPLRFAGGHIHIGCEGGMYGSPYQDILHNEKKKVELIKLLDYTLGNFCVLLDQEKRAEKRREYYGKAGVYRSTSYGLEYRVLSSFWLRHPAFAMFVLGFARSMVFVAHSYGSVHEEIMGAVEPDAIITAINENDKELAWQNWIKVKRHLLKVSLDDSVRKEMLQMMEYISMIGIENFAPKIQESWNLGSYHCAHANALETLGPTNLKMLRDAEFVRFSAAYQDDQVYI